MFKIIPILLMSFLLAACGAVASSAPSPEHAATSPVSGDAACGPPSSWTIEYHRTGGFGGFDQTLTLQSDGSLTVQSERPAVDKQLMIPEDHVEPIKDLLAQACPFPTGRAEGACADCYNYQLKIEMNGQTYDLQASDTTLTEDVRPLVTTLDQFLQLAAGQ